MVTTCGSGGFSRSIDIASVSVGEFITVFATNASGNTSEFSRAVKVNTRGGACDSTGPGNGGRGNGRPGNCGGNPNALLSVALNNLSVSSSDAQTIADDEAGQLVTKASHVDPLAAATDQVFATLEDDTNDRDFDLEYLLDDDTLVEGIIGTEPTLESNLDSGFVELGTE